MYFIGDRGVDMIKSYEGLRLTAYFPTPDDVLTIGYGHTKTAKPGMTITMHEADLLLLDDIHWVEAVVNTYVKVTLNQNQYDALCSFVYNIGGTQFKKSTLLRKLNEMDYVGASYQFKRWNKQNGKVLKGLSRRRKVESELFDRVDKVPFREALMSLFRRKGTK